MGLASEPGTGYSGARPCPRRGKGETKVLNAHMLAAAIGRRWFSILVSISVIFVLVTLLSFVFEGRGMLSRLLFWFGLAGENNAGAWWSGMVLLLGAVFAYDGFATPDKPEPARRGWLALAVMLLILSFDEIGSLHEYLASRGMKEIGVLAALIAAIGLYGLMQLYRSGTERRALSLVVAAFVLFATIPVQEYFQHSLEWPRGWIYGARGAVEEGTELAAILLLIAATRRHPPALLEHHGDTLVGLTRHRSLVLIASIMLLPPLVAATFVLPYPGGPADWLASSLYFGCALLVVRRLVKASTASTAALSLIAFYLVASLGSNGINLAWDPEIWGREVVLRGIFVAGLLVAAVPVLAATGRRPTRLLPAAAPLVIILAALTDSQIVWCTVPVVAALWLYSIESGSTVRLPTTVAKAHEMPDRDEAPTPSPETVRGA